MHVHAHMCACMLAYVGVLAEARRELEGQGDCEPPSVGIENKMLVLSKTK